VESVFADPKIEKLLEYDFALSGDSPAFSIGFNPLPEYITKNK
jgi:hypothetical protein